MTHGHIANHGPSTFRRPWRWPSQRPAVEHWGATAWLGLGATCLSVLYLLRPTLLIKFGVIDDHEIVSIIGNGERLPITHIPAEIWERTGEPLGRFRPVYWTFRVLEATVAGQHPAVWYADRIGLALITVGAIYATVVKFTHPVSAACISLLPFAGPQIEAWTRLGPNEAYAMPLSCLGILVVVSKTRRGVPPGGQWLGYLLLALSAGAKENWLLVSVPVVLFSIAMHGLQRWSRRDVVVVVTFAAVTALDVFVLFRRVRHFGSVYVQDRSWDTAKAWATVAYDLQVSTALLLTGIVVATALLAVAPLTKRKILVVALIGATSSAMWLLQAIFYAGAPQVWRYLYPVALGPVVAWTIAGYAASIGERRWGARIVAGLILILLVPGIRDAWRTTRQAAEASAAASQSFQDGLARLEITAKQADAGTIVMQPWEASTDMERSLSVARFVSAQTGLQVMVLPAPQASDAYSAALNETLRAWSHSGEDAFTPYRATSDCISVVFASGSPVCPVSVPPPG